MLEKALFFYRDGTFEIMGVALNKEGRFFPNYRVAVCGKEILLDFHMIMPFDHGGQSFPAYLEPIDEKDSTLFGHSVIGLRKTLRDALNRNPGKPSIEYFKEQSMPNYIPLHDAIDNMIPLIPLDYVDRDTVVGLLEGKKQESIDNVKTQKILRKETEKQILGVYLTPLQATNPWVNDVARAFYETVPL